MAIRKAEESDLDQICSIAAEWELKNIPRRDSGNGFLVSSFGRDEYLKYLNNEKFYVFEDDGEIRAFILVFTEEELDYSLTVNLKIKDYADAPFLVIKQICVNKRYAKKGYATKLYEYLISEVEKDIYLAVVLKPGNTASFDFHRKMDFHQIFKFQGEDEINRSVFYRKSQKKTEFKYDKEILINQHNTAATLYMHEDNLNWSKLNHLFYLNGSLVAVISILLTWTGAAYFMYSLAAVSFIGGLASFLFFIAIDSGIAYMQKRKQALVDIEKSFIKITGIRVISSGYGKKDEKYRKSPTTIAMRMIPKILSVIWCIVFIFSMIKILL